MFLVEQTTVPGAAIPVQELKDHLLLGSGFADDGAQDIVLENYLRAAIDAIEARTGKVLLEKQYTWSLTMWRDRECQALPTAPISSIDALRTLDSVGAATLVDAISYALVPDDHRPAMRALSGNLATIPSLGSVEIDFTAGYGTAWANVPVSLQQAVLMLAAHYYESRSGAGKSDEIPFGITSLIQKFRNIRLVGGFSR